MGDDDETVIHVTPNAPWLPTGSRAEVIRSTVPPQPMSVVRLLLLSGDSVFCVPRSDNGQSDLPARRTPVGDVTGAIAARDLADQTLGRQSAIEFVGAVRNMVESAQEGYIWPTPVAHFGVWVSADPPIVDGVWLPLTEDSPLRDRHWFPLVASI